MDKRAAHIADTLIPEVHISFHSAVMQVSAYMLGICEAGIAEAWTIQGNVARHKAIAQMPSMGRKRVRPGAVKVGVLNYELRITSCCSASNYELLNYELSILNRSEARIIQNS